MRIIGGKHKGKRLRGPKLASVRPTTDKAKEALFSIMTNRYNFQEKNMLDLFSGTGNISYEFASRGCNNITAVDNNKNCINYIISNANKLNLKINTIKSDSYKYLENCKEKFNFIFADPPYKYNRYYQLKDLIINKDLIKKEGCLIIEHDKNISFKEKQVEVRKYGTVHFSIFSF